jgi:uncharacterized protein (DUF433 family)
MKILFTPNEAAAFVSLPPKRVYKELEYRVIQTTPNTPRLPFAALIYLRAFKEINFEFSVNYRSVLYQRLLEAWEKQEEILEISRFFILRLDEINKELSDLIEQFNEWKNCLVTDPNIMAGETVFPNLRLSVNRIGGMIERGESPEFILQDYPYLSENDLKFAPLYVKAYPPVGRPKKEDTGVPSKGSS